MGKRKLNIFDVFAGVLSHVLCACAGLLMQEDWRAKSFFALPDCQGSNTRLACNINLGGLMHGGLKFSVISHGFAYLVV